MPGTAGIVKHKLLPEKVLGKKKECRRRGFFPDMYKAYAVY